MEQAQGGHGLQAGRGAEQVGEQAAGVTASRFGHVDQAARFALDLQPVWRRLAIDVHAVEVLLGAVVADELEAAIQVYAARSAAGRAPAALRWRSGGCAPAPRCAGRTDRGRDRQAARGALRGRTRPRARRGRRYRRRWSVAAAHHCQAARELAQAGVEVAGGDRRGAARRADQDRQHAPLDVVEHVAGLADERVLVACHARQRTELEQDAHDGHEVAALLAAAQFEADAGGGEALVAGGDDDPLGKAAERDLRRRRAPAPTAPGTEARSGAGRTGGASAARAPDGCRPRPARPA